MAGMDVDLDSDDEVIGEIPVYYRSCKQSQIALINYPLRPRDKPYDGPDLGALHQVQIKPEHGSLQFQYRSECRPDHDPAEARVFTLTSNRLRPQSTYAIGRICNGQLHLTPIDQVHAMLPNFAAVDAAAAAARASMRTVSDADHEAPETKAQPKEVLLRAAQSKTPSGEPSEARKSYQMLRQEWDGEKWVSLHIESEESGSSAALRSALSHLEMDECERIAMETPLGDYLTSLCSPASSSSRHAAPSAEPGTSLQTRCFNLLKNAGVMQFGELCDVLGVADDARDDVVKILVSRAVLVQNCWVPKSALLLSGRASIARDYLLQLFAMGRELKLSDWTAIAQLDLVTSLQIIGSLATLDRETKRWVFNCEFDYVFGASYEDVVAEQNRARQRIDALAQLTGTARAKTSDTTDISASLKQTPAPAKTAPVKRSQAPAEAELVKAEPKVAKAEPKVVKAGKEPVNVPTQRTEVVKDKPEAVNVELDADVRYFVSEQLERSGVVTIGALLTAYRATSRSVTEAEMTAAVNVVARPFVGSGFCRRTIDANDEVFELFRNVFIEMFRAAPSKAFRKADIKTEILQRTKVELPEKAYSKLTKELARLIKGSWIAKTAE